MRHIVFLSHTHTPFLTLTLTDASTSPQYCLYLQLSQSSFFGNVSWLLVQYQVGVCVCLSLPLSLPLSLSPSPRPPSPLPSLSPPLSLYPSLSLPLSISLYLSVSPSLSLSLSPSLCERGNRGLQMGRAVFPLRSANLE